MAKQIVPKCTCKICKTPANKIDEYIIEAKENGYSDVDTYVRENEGTYNPDTGCLDALDTSLFLESYTPRRT